MNITSILLLLFLILKLQYHGDTEGNTLVLPYQGPS